MLHAIGTAILAGGINDVIPDGPDYSGIGFLTGPAAFIIGNALAFAQIGALVVVAVSLAFFLRASENKAETYRKWLVRGIAVLVAATLFNVLITGGMGFINGLFSG